MVAQGPRVLDRPADRHGLQDADLVLEYPLHRPDARVLRVVGRVVLTLSPEAHLALRAVREEIRVLRAASRCGSKVQLEVVLARDPPSLGLGRVHARVRTVQDLDEKRALAVARTREDAPHERLAVHIGDVPREVDLPASLAEQIPEESLLTFAGPVLAQLNVGQSDRDADAGFGVGRERENREKC